MHHPKKRVRQHVMEDRSIRIVQDVLPDEWVVRSYRPDYGIDLAIELFEPLADEPGTAIALGEAFLVQVKSTETVESFQLRVDGRGNVERAPLRQDASGGGHVRVARLRLETSELLTVQAMGAAVPVLLFLVELSTRRIYFVCLNDLIDKVILPEDPGYAAKQSRTIHIPLSNLVEAGRAGSERPLAAYAKRAKLYAAFQKFAYQENELNLTFDGCDPDLESYDERSRELLDLVRHFLTVLLRYDFWTRIPEWPPIRASYDELIALQKVLRQEDVERDPTTLLRYLREAPHSWYDTELIKREMLNARPIFMTHVGMIWHRLSNLGRIYEERAREWFLPV